MNYWIFALACCCVFELALADTNPPLPEFDANYQVTVAGIKVAKLNRKLRWQAERYTYESTLKATGLLALVSDKRDHEKSEGTFSERFVPQRYTRTRSKGKKTKTWVVNFNYESQVVDSKGHNFEVSYPLVGELLDRMIYQLQIAVDSKFASQRERYGIADRRKRKEYLVERLAAEKLETVLGPLATERIERRKNDQQKTVFWLAPKLHWLPVKVEHQDDGELTVATLLEIKFNAQP